MTKKKVRFDRLDYSLCGIVGAGMLIAFLVSCTESQLEQAKVDLTADAVFAKKVACGTYSQAKAPLAIAISSGLISTEGADAASLVQPAADKLCAQPGIATSVADELSRINGAAAAILLQVAASKLPPAATPKP